MNDLDPYVEDVLERCRHLEEGVSDVVEADAITMEEGFESLLALREAKAALLRASQALAEHVHGLMPARKVHVPGMGDFQQHSGASRVWDDEAALAALVKVARESRQPDEHGEVARAEDVLAQLLTSCAKVNYWRVKALEAVGLQANKLSRWESGRPGIQLPRRGE